jgi:hypothetical protein
MTIVERIQYKRNAADNGKCVSYFGISGKLNGDSCFLKGANLRTKNKGNVGKGYTQYKIYNSWSLKINSSNTPITCSPNTTG